jgi:hypothetical protein
MISLALSIIISNNLFVSSLISSRSTDLTIVKQQSIKAMSSAIAEKKKYSLSSFSIGGVNPEMAGHNVIEKLGKPRKTDFLWSCTKVSTLKYAETLFHITSIHWSISLETPSCAYEVSECVPLNTLDDRIALSQHPVWYVSTSNLRYRTDQGVKVGDSIAKTKKIYNRVLSPSLSQKPGILEYTERGDHNLHMDLRFKYKNDKITRIEYEKYYKNC